MLDFLKKTKHYYYSALCFKVRKINSSILLTWAYLDVCPSAETHSEEVALNPLTLWVLGSVFWGYHSSSSSSSSSCWLSNSSKQTGCWAVPGCSMTSNNCLWGTNSDWCFLGDGVTELRGMPARSFHQAWALPGEGKAVSFLLCPGSLSSSPPAFYACPQVSGLYFLYVGNSCNVCFPSWVATLTTTTTPTNPNHWIYKSFHEDHIKTIFSFYYTWKVMGDIDCYD